MGEQSVSSAWLENSQAYTPDLEDSAETKSAFHEFAQLHLSSETRIRLLCASLESSSNSSVPYFDSLSVIDAYRRCVDVEYTIVDEEKLTYWLTRNKQTRFNLFFINRFLVESNHPTPTDAAKLRASPLALDSLAAHFNIAPAFIYALSRYHLPTGKGQRVWVNEQNASQYDFWYSIPVRLKVKCTAHQLKHDSSTSGSNQIDPFYYLHLADHDIDIRGGRIFLYFSYQPGSRSTCVIAVNMLDGRWVKPVEEPQKRIRDMLKSITKPELSDDPCFIHLIYFTSVLKWWTNALESIDAQLISYERGLQNDVQQETNPGFYEDLNKALHAMASHLHRYASELNSLDEILSGIRKYHKDTHSGDGTHKSPNESQFQRIENGLQQVVSQLQAVRNFEKELEKKLQNNLALLFNRIQLGHDRALLANSLAMQEILKVTQDEIAASKVMAVRANELTVEMKKDSLSMKTIAILTMFFLPGTSFAALLAMPFFTQDPWLDKVSSVWVWVVLTVPSTGLAFIFYIYWKRRGERRSKQEVDTEEGIEMSEVGCQN